MNFRKENKRVRIQVFSGTSSSYKQYELSWHGMIMLGALTSLGISLLFMGCYLIVDTFYYEISFAAEPAKPLAQQESEPQPAAKIQTVSHASADGFPNNPLLSMLAASRVEPQAKQGDYPEEGGQYRTDSSKIGVLLDSLENKINKTIEKHEQLNFEEVNAQLQHIPSIKPLAGGRISDIFGKRQDPFQQRTAHHNGIDIAAPKGTLVYAPADGIVEKAQTTYRINKGYGRMVIINHGKGIKTRFGHLHKVFVKPGQKINRYDSIGLVGSTGRSTGPHLHYELWDNDKAVDPLEFMIK